MHSDNEIKSLYIHVPFCSSKCSYCDFFSIENSDFSLKKRVVESTLEQLKYYSDHFSFRGIETVYIGGGTPTSLPPSLLEKLIYGITDSLDSEIREFSVEINPETVDEELVIFLKDTPLTRLSIGIQSFSNRFLNILGRNSSSRSCMYALEFLKNTGRDMNIDLISSIPGQKTEDCIKDIKTALSFSPEHISLYSLTIEEGTPISEIADKKDIDDESWINGSDYLEISGFEHYEISNFAAKGKRCLHNMNYWMMKPYLGCGPASVSTLFKDRKPFRLFNSSDISSYLEGAGNKWNIREEKISSTDYLIETLMMGFRISDGITESDFTDIFGTDIYGIIPETIIKWIGKGMLKKGEGNLYLTDKGRLFHSSFIIDIMDELDKSKFSLS